MGPTAGLDTAVVKRSSKVPKFQPLPGIKPRSFSPYPNHYTD